MSAGGRTGGHVSPPARAERPALASSPAPLEAPTLAFFAVFLGGVFVLTDGLLILGAGPTAFTVGYAIPPAFADELGGVGVALGVAILAVGFLLHENLDQRRSASMILLVLAVASLLSGGGFLVGFALSTTGALVALLHRPSHWTTPRGNPLR